MGGKRLCCSCPEPRTTLDMDDTQASIQLPINVNSISVNEIRLTIKQLKNGKAVGVDSIQQKRR